MAKFQFKAGQVVRPFKIDAAAGWPAVSGTVRPALPAEVDEHDRKAAGLQGEKRTAAKAAFYAAHLATWDVTDGDDAPAPIRADVLLALPYPVWVQLEGVVLGTSGAEVLGE